MPDPIPVVYVVDDNLSVREALKDLISEAGWLPAIFASAEAFLSSPRATCPSCLILDIVLPGLSGIELQQRIAKDRADIPILFITRCNDVQTTVRAMKAGAFDFLMKPFDPKVLQEAMRLALDHSREIQKAALEMKAVQDRYETLSRREREVMHLVVSGLMNKQVGGELGICEMTVKVHRGRMMRKMKAGSLAELVNIAKKLPCHEADHAGSCPC